MYIGYFRLTDPPFSLTPDPRFLFLSGRHREGLAHLLYGIQQAGGFVQLTGEIGSGKTTLCRSLVKQLPPGTDVALILNPRQTAIELLASICDELSVTYPRETRSIKLLVDALNRRLLDAYASGRRTVLIIDEAQNLHSDVLEQIRLLTNLETSQDKLLQIILIGQPELLSVLKQDKLLQLAQRITARYHLTALSRRETYDYIRHRLSVAGRNDPLFTAQALFHVYRLSGGVPRLINIICDRALLGAYALDRPQVTAAIVRRAHRETRGVLPWYRQIRALWTAGIVALGILTIGSALFLNSHSLSPVRREEAARGSDAPEADSRPARPASGANPARAAGSDPDPSFTTTSSGANHDPRIGRGDTAGTTGLGAAELSRQAGNEPVSRADVSAARLSSILSDPSLRGSAASSFASLFAQLGIKVPPDQSDIGCKVAGDQGFDCFSRVGNWTKLRYYDLPAILDLTLPSGSRHRVTLAGLGESSATVAIGGREYIFPLDEIESLWDGTFLLLWRLPFNSYPLSNGARGEDVAWIRRTLDIVEGKDPGAPDPGVFDEALRRRVMAFQRGRSLPQDGVVGSATLVRLTLAAMGPNAPSLSHHAPRS